MKKWLILFVLVDFIFVGLVLKLSSENQRNIAGSKDASYSEMSDGQKLKYDLVQSFSFLADQDHLILKTNRLQSICETALRIEVSFAAINVAIAGTQPAIKHLFKCEVIKQNLAQSELMTSVKDFFAIQNLKKMTLADGELQAFMVYADEEFPNDWKLNEIKVIGESSFTITNDELEKVHTDHRFEFTLATSVK